MGTMGLFKFLAGISEPLEPDLYERKYIIYGSTIIVLNMNYTALSTISFSFLYVYVYACS